jgi:hypothetical protein
MNDKTAAFIASIRSTLDRIETGDLEAASYTAMAEAARSGDKNYPTGRYTYTLEIIDPVRFAEHQEIGGEVIK